MDKVVQFHKFLYEQAFRDTRSICSIWPLNDLTAQAEKQKIFNQARESIRAYQQILSLQHQTNIEQKIQTFPTQRQGLDAILREFADRQEAVMNQKEDRGRTLEQSGTATVGDYTDFLLELFQADYPLVAGGVSSNYRRYRPPDKFIIPQCHD